MGTTSAVVGSTTSTELEPGSRPRTELESRNGTRYGTGNGTRMEQPRYSPTAASIKKEVLGHFLILDNLLYHYSPLSIDILFTVTQYIYYFI